MVNTGTSILGLTIQAKSPHNIDNACVNGAKSGTHRRLYYTAMNQRSKRTPRAIVLNAAPSFLNPVNMCALPIGGRQWAKKGPYAAKQGPSVAFVSRLAGNLPARSTV